MKINGWKYYNHAIIPDVEPHEEPDVLPVKNGNIWKIGGYSLIGKVDNRF